MTVTEKVKHFLKNNLECQNVTDNMLLRADLKLDELDVYELIHAVECQFKISVPDSIAKDYAKGVDCTVAELIQKIEKVVNKNMTQTEVRQPSKIKSVVLNKTEITDRHYIVEFYNPWWGRFAIDFEYDNMSHTEHNMLNIMRVGDYFMVKGKPSNAEVNDVCEFSIVRYMRYETDKARQSGQELIIPNMSVREMDNLADNILDSLNKFKKEKEKSFIKRVEKFIVDLCK